MSSVRFWVVLLGRFWVVQRFQRCDEADLLLVALASEVHDRVSAPVKALPFQEKKPQPKARAYFLETDSNR
jgi:hypothetical protein